MSSYSTRSSSSSRVRKDRPVDVRPGLSVQETQGRAGVRSAAWSVRMDRNVRSCVVPVHWASNGGRPGPPKIRERIEHTTG